MPRTAAGRYVMSHAQTWVGPVATSSRGRRCVRGPRASAVPQQTAAAQHAVDRRLRRDEHPEVGELGHELMRREPDEFGRRRELHDLRLLGGGQRIRRPGRRTATQVVAGGSLAPALDGASVEAGHLAGAVTARAGGHRLGDEPEDHLSLPSSVSSSSAAWPAGNKS